jgi:uncharacterized protein (DUF4415 family)
MNRQEEAALRAAADATHGGDEVLDARAVTGKDFKQMVSLRLDANLIASLRDIADERGESLSTILREAADALVRNHRSQQIRVETVQQWQGQFSTRIVPEKDSGPQIQIGTFSRSVSGNPIVA